MNIRRPRLVDDQNVKVHNQSFTNMTKYVTGPYHMKNKGSNTTCYDTNHVYKTKRKIQESPHRHDHIRVRSE